MTIEFSCICKGTTVIASHQSGYGGYQDVVNSMLPNIQSTSNGKTTYASDNHSFHVLVDNGILFICAAEPSFGKLKPFTYLAEVKKRFASSGLVVRASSAGPNELNRDFAHVLSDLMEKSARGQLGQMDVLQNQVDEVKGVMTQNIEKVIDRGERLEDLIDKTDELQAHSQAFQKTSKKISRKYWWKNTKMTIILVGVGLTLLTIVIIVILYSTGVLPPDSGSSSKTTVAPSISP
ncbi:hypothetical protein LOTGIDRAFT_228972 [Lottia gigantea]|uniref:Vesicle-associated membrane protein 7 n=1 Tax=Lottia gigantea TaxID=225164 RepID=V3ZXD3_LOTGI|nr:hypothetical protein LOTGIDRAFT_228972 [Lottia gigantea]ESO89037.1 hypothetical protein LOTGIDRAFT_228972 [Lottia gigantea]